MSPRFGSKESFRAEKTDSIKVVEHPLSPEMSIMKRYLSPPNPFPVTVLGSAWSETVERIARVQNVRPDYVAVPLLVLNSAMLGNARTIRAPGITQPAVLWGINVGDASSKKSSSSRVLMSGVVRRLGLYVSRSYPERLAQWSEACAEAKNFKQEPPPRPMRPLVDVNDINAPALVQVLAQQPKGALLYYDELSGLFDQLTRPDSDMRSFLLKAFDGSSYTVHRVKFDEPLTIPCLAVPLFGTIQPDKLAERLGMLDDGLMSRFLLTLPEPRGDFELGDPVSLDSTVHRLSRLADLQMDESETGEMQPVVIELEAAAHPLLKDMHDRWQALSEASYGLLASAAGKAYGQALRLALNLEYLWWSADGTRPEPQHISAKALAEAALLMDTYFLPMAERVYGEAEEPDERRRARVLADWILKAQPTSLNVSHIRDKLRLSGLRTTDAIKDTLRSLCQSGWLATEDWTGARGNPAQTWIVNPSVYTTRN